MDYKLYRDLNYIVLIQDTVRVDYPIVNTYYTYNENSQDYTIRTANTKIRESVINRGDISNYSNELNVNYDENTMLSFLRLYASLTDKIPAPIIPETIPMLPSGTYIPKNTVVGAFDLLWENKTSNITTGDGIITCNIGSSFAKGASFKIDHSGDFELNFKVTADNLVGGICYFKDTFLSSNTFYGIDHCILYQSGFAFMYGNGESHAQTSSSVSDVLSIVRTGTNISYKVNSVSFYNHDIDFSSPINFNCSMAGLGDIFDIEIIIP